MTKLLIFCLISQFSAASELGFFELIVKDQKRAQTFYSRVLGWKFQDAGSKDFVLVTNAGIDGALLSTGQTIKRGESVKMFFKSTNLAVDLEKVAKEGGREQISPTETGGDTWIAEFTDPDGNWIGLICKKPNSCTSTNVK